MSVPFSQELAKASFDRHKATPTISTDAYFAFKSAELAKAMSQKRIIYLDTCHWINLRHVVLNSPLEKPGYREILGLLQKLHEQQKICCPISFILFEELMKQADLNTRRSTARLMDQFSDGVCFQFPPDIMQLEVRQHLLRIHKGDEAVELAGSVWTKCGFVAGELLPTISMMSDQENCLMQKAWIDEMWRFPLEGTLEYLKSTAPLPDMWTEYVQAMNVDAMNIRAAQLTYDEILELEKVVLFRKEVTKVIEIVSDELLNAFPDLRDPSKRRPATTVPPSPWTIPSFQILAGIVSANIYSGKKFIVNDLHDFHHAALAIPYCDALFCDHPMALRLRDKPCQFGQIYDTTILSRPEEIRKYLIELTL